MLYQVWRRDTAGGAFAYFGAAGVIYKLQAVRSTATWPWATFNVNFGRSASTGSSSATRAKIAA